MTTGRRGSDLESHPAWTLLLLGVGLVGIAVETSGNRALVVVASLVVAAGLFSHWLRTPFGDSGR